MSAGTNAGTAVDWSGPERVASAIEAVRQEVDLVLPRMAAAFDPSECAELAGRLALLCAREAAWWRVLARRTPSGVPFLYRGAAIRAQATMRDQARAWQTSEARWRDLATQQMPSDRPALVVVSGSDACEDRAGRRELPGGAR